MAFDYSDGMQLARETEQANAHDRCRPRFFMDTIEKEGEVEMVEIEVPGDPKLKPVHKVTDEHRNRWPTQYQRFKQGLEQKLDGEALEQWPALTKGQCERYRALGIRTVQDFAHLPDAAANDVGPDFYKLREAAKRRTQPESATVAQLAASDAAKDRKIAELEARLNQMANQQVQAAHIAAAQAALAPAPAPMPAADLDADAPPQPPLPRKPPPKNQPR